MTLRPSYRQTSLTHGSADTALRSRSSSTDSGSSGETPWMQSSSLMEHHRDSSAGVGAVEDEYPRRLAWALRTLRLLDALLVRDNNIEQESALSCPSSSQVLSSSSSTAAMLAELMRSCTSMSSQERPCLLAISGEDSLGMASAAYAAAVATNREGANRWCTGLFVCLFVCLFAHTCPPAGE